MVRVVVVASLLLGMGACSQGDSLSTVPDEPGPVKFREREWALGDPSGEVSSRTCLARTSTLPVDPDEVARERVEDDRLDTSIFARGSGSLEQFYKCLGDVVRYVSLADFNGDLLPDVLVQKSPQDLIVYWNRMGVFTPQPLPPSGRPRPDATTPVIIDVDNDGRLDVALMPRPGHQFMTVFRGKGVEFEDPFDIPMDDILGYANSVVLEDINTDGFADVLVGIRTNHGLAATAPEKFPLRLFLSTGGAYPYLREATRTMLSPTKPDQPNSPGAGPLTEDQVRGYQPFLPVVADFDSDGDLDVYVASDSGSSRLFLREGLRFVDRSAERGTFESVSGMGAQALDFDSDGDLDIFTTEIRWDSVQSLCRFASSSAKCRTERGNTLFINDGSAHFKEEAAYFNVEDTGFSWGFSSTDLNGDGYLDLFVGTGEIARSRTDIHWEASVDRPYLLLGSDRAFIDRSGEILREMSFPGTSVIVASADMNADFRPDLLVAGRESHAPRLFDNLTSTGSYGLLLLEGTGSGGSPTRGESSLVRVEVVNRPPQLFPYPGRMTNYLSQSVGVPIPVGFGEADEAIATVRFSSGVEVTRKIFPGQVNVIRESGK